MTRRILAPVLAFAAFAAILYASRFWFLRAWEGPLFGIDALRPEGGLLGRWLRGTDLAAFELLLWAVAAFLLLTALQWLIDRLPPLKRRTGKDRT